MKRYIPGFTGLTTNMLRYFDRILGRPMSRILFLIKKIIRKKRTVEGIQKFHAKKILLIKLWGIGSTILLSPVIHNLRKKYPNVQIHFLTKKGLHTLYDKNVFDKVYFLNTGGVLNAIKDFIFVPLKLIREKYDIVMDFEFVSYYTACLTYMINPKYSVGIKVIGKTKDKLYDFTTIYHESKPISTIFCLSLGLLGIDDICYDLISPYFSDQDEKKVFEEIKDIRNCIAINVNTSDLALERRWPIQYYQILIDALAQGEKILLTGSPSERSYVQEIYDKLEHKDNVLNIAGKYSLTQAFAVLKYVKLFITNDSGPLHVAVSYQTPTISFFGPSSPLIYGPNYKKELHKVFVMNLFCSPCISDFRDKFFVCEYKNRCMFEIRPEKVIDAVKKFLIQKRFDNSIPQ